MPGARYQCTDPACEFEWLGGRNEKEDCPKCAPIPMLLFCPMCRERHVDKGTFATKAHHTHACQACGFVWRPAVRATVGAEFLPGFKHP